MKNETQPVNKEALETPSQVETALSEAYSNYFEPNRVNDELRVARRLYPTHYESQLEMKLDPEVSAYMAAQYKAAWKKIRPENLTSIFIATLAPAKKEVFNKIASEFKIPLNYQEPGLDEEDMHDFADDKNVLLNWTPFHIASQKALRNAPSSHPWMVTEPRIAADTIVVSNENVLHKPKDVESATAILRNLSGSDVIVRTGIYLDMTTYNGEYFDWMGGSAIKIPIAQLTEEQIANFISKNYTEIMNIAGGIDYSSVDGQSLIDPKRFIEFVPTEVGITDAHLDDNLDIDWKNSIKLKISALNGLKSHLKGAPAQPIKRIFQNIRTIYDTA